MKYFVIGIVSTATLLGITQFHTTGEMTYSNVFDRNRHLIVLSAPSVHNDYYREDFSSIVTFQKQYARTVLGNDNVIILVDADTLPYYNDLPSDILLETDIEDIWMRDFSTVHPEKMAQFTYDPSYFENRDDAEYIQESFVEFTDRH